jgi:hypothetical protein
MNKQRKTSHILNVFQYDADGHVVLPASLTLGIAPGAGDNNSKVPTTAWVRTYVTGLTYLTGNQSITVSGDATGSGTTSINLTLANTAVTPGTYGSATLVPVVTVDSKGRITSVTTASISGALTFTGDVTGIGTTGTSTGLTLANSGVTAGTYTKVTVDSKGRVTVGASATTTDIAEGTRLYYTDARVLAYLGANNYATQSYVSTQINNLVSGAPGLLDTLDELAQALGDDPNFATTTATSLGNRLRIDTASQGLNSTQQANGRTNLGLGTAALSATGDFATAAQGTKADTAHGWGNHASVGYLTTSSAASTYVSLTGSYANPSWITSLAYSKITGVPAFLTSYTETDPFRVTSVAVSGTSTKTITLTRADSSTVSTTWTDIDTDTNTFASSLGFSGGTLTLTNNNASTVAVSLDGRYLQSYSETDTLASVTGRGSSTTSSISAANFQNAYQVLSLNNIKTPGLYNYDGGISGTQPLGTEWYNVRTIELGADGRYSQFVMPYNVDRIFYRRKSDAGFAAYVELYHSGNLTNLNQLSNGPGYITSYTETDTLASVTARGASTSTAVTFSGAVNIYNTDSNDFRLYYQGAASGSARVYYHQPTNELRIYATAATTDGTTSIGSLKLYISSVYREVLHAANYSSYALPLSGGTVTGTVTINGGGAHPLAISSGQRYQLQVRNTNNSINSGYGWWWFMDTNFNMGFHADGASDRFTLTRDGNLSVSGTVSGSNLSGTNTGDQTNISGNAGSATRLGAQSVNLNTGRTPGTLEFYDQPGGTGAPNGNWHNYISTRHGNAANEYGFQIANQFGTETLLFRGFDGSNPLSWRTVWHSGSLTNLSQLTNGPGYITGESDTLASVTGRGASTSTNLTFSGQLTLNKSGTQLKISRADTAAADWFFHSWASGLNIYPNAVGTVYFGRDGSSTNVDVYNGTLYQQGNPVWHSGNLTNLNQLSNGPGYITSASYVAGLNLTGLGNSSMNVNNGGTAVYRNENGAGGNLSYAPVLHLGGSDTMWQIQGDYYSSTDLRWRAGYAGTWYAWRQIIHSANIGSQSVSYASTAGTANSVAWTNVSGRPSALSQFSNDSGYITSSGSASSAGTVTGRQRGTFTVGGNVSTFYPVAFQIGSGATGEQGISVLQIERGGYDEPGYSNHTFTTFHARIRAKADGWGYGASYVQVEANAYTTPMMADVTQQNQTSQLIVWLRGGTAYRWMDIEGGWNLNFSNPSGGNYSTFNGNAVYSPTTSNTIGGNFKYQQGWGNNYISGRLTAGNGVTAQSQIIAALHSSATPDYSNPLWIWAAQDSDAIVIQNTTAGGNPPKIYFRDTNGTIQTSNTLIRLRTSNSDSLSAWLNGSTWNVTGDVVAYASDKRLKENIKIIPNAIEKVSALSGVTFDWNTTSEKAGFVPKRKYDEIGVLAQDVQNVIPQAVEYAPFDRNDDGTSKSGENYLTVKYEKIVPLLIEAIKEQQLQIEKLQNKLDNVLSSR